MIRLPAKLVVISLIIIAMFTASMANGGWSAPKRLNKKLPFKGDVFKYRLTSDDLHVVYSADQDLEGEINLYSVSIAKNGKVGKPVKLNDKFGKDEFIDTWVITPDGKHVIYSTSLKDGFTLNSQEKVDARKRLLSVPVSGGQVIQLNADLQPEQGILRMRIYDNLTEKLTNSHVIFAVGPCLDDEVGDCYFPTEETKYYFAPVQGGTQHFIGKNISKVVLTPDSSYVIYEPGDIDHKYLYSLPVDGGNPILLHESLSVYNSGSNIIRNRIITPDSQKTVICENGSLYAIPIAGIAAPIPLQIDLPDIIDIECEFFFEYDNITSDGRYMIISRDTGHDSFNPSWVGLYRVDLNGGPGRMLLSDAYNGRFNWTSPFFSNDQEFVLYSEQLPSSARSYAVNYYSIPLAGGAAIKLNSLPVPQEGGVRKIQVTSDGSVSFLYSLNVSLGASDTENWPHPPYTTLYKVPPEGGIPKKLIDDSVAHAVGIQDQIIYRWSMIEGKDILVLQTREGDDGSNYALFAKTISNGVVTWLSKTWHKYAVTKGFASTKDGHIIYTAWKGNPFIGDPAQREKNLFIQTYKPPPPPEKPDGMAIAGPLSLLLN